MEYPEMESNEAETDPLMNLHEEFDISVKSENLEESNSIFFLEENREVIVGGGDIQNPKDKRKNTGTSKPLQFTLMQGSRRGSTYFVSGDYAYVRSKDHGHVCNVRCCKYQSKSCPVIGRVIGDKLYLMAGREHICGCKASDWERLATFNAMKAEAISSTKSLKTLYEEKLAEGNTSIDFKEVISCLRACRQSAFPPDPGSAEECTLAMANRDILYSEYFKSEVTHEDESKRVHRAMIFCSEKMTAKLCEGTEYFVDTSFRHLPIQFGTLLNIHFVYKNVIIPVFHILITEKSVELLIAVLHRLTQDYPEMNPSTILSNFDIVLRQALKSVFPDARIGGCRVLFSQAIYKNIHRLSFNIQSEHKNDVNVHRWFRRVMALCLLPPFQVKQEVKILWADTKQMKSETTTRKLRLFHKHYLRNFWMRKIQPENFSVYGLPHKTNNACEQMYIRLKKNLPPQPMVPSFFKFLDSMGQHLLLKGEERLERIESGQGVIDKHSPESVSQTKTISEYEEMLESGECTPGDFLALVGVLYRKIAKLRPEEEALIDEIDSQELPYDEIEPECDDGYSDIEGEDADIEEFVPMPLKQTKRQKEEEQKETFKSKYPSAAKRAREEYDPESPVRSSSKLLPKQTAVQSRSENEPSVVRHKLTPTVTTKRHREDQNNPPRVPDRQQPRRSGPVCLLCKNVLIIIVYMPCCQACICRGCISHIQACAVIDDIDPICPSCESPLVKVRS